MDANPQRPNFDLIELLYGLWLAIVKHAMGIGLILFGTVAKVYIVKKEYRRVSRSKCWLSIIFSGIAGTITYSVLYDSPMQIHYKAVIIGFMPVMVEPVMMRILIWVNPIIDAIGTWLKELISKKSQ